MLKLISICKITNLGQLWLLFEQLEITFDVVSQKKAKKKDVRMRPGFVDKAEVRFGHGFFVKEIAKKYFKLK